MSEEVKQQPKRRGGSPEFMAKMREKAAQKKREMGLVSKAEKLKKNEEFKSKVEEAKLIVEKTKKTHQPVQEEIIEEDYIEPTPPIEKKQPKQSVKEPTEPNYKQLYYKHKLEQLTQPPKEHNEPKQKSSKLPHELAVNSIKTDVNKQIMGSIFSQYFPDIRNPYL